MARPLLSIHRRGDILRPVRSPRDERDVDTQESRQVAGDTVIEREAHCRPPDRLRCEHWREHHLVGAAIDEAIELQDLAI